MKIRNILGICYKKNRKRITIQILKMNPYKSVNKRRKIKFAM